MKLAAAESLLLVGLVTLSVSVAREAAATRFANYGLVELAATALVVAGLYWLLSWRGRVRLAFLLIALIALLPHVPAIWSHNRLELYRLFGLDATVTAFNSTTVDGVLLLASLVGLAALHRLAGLRRMDRQLRSQGAMDSDRGSIVLGEAGMLLGLTAAALLSSFLLVLLAALAGRVETLLDWSPWTVLLVGVGGALVFTSTLALWFRSQREGEPTV